MSPSTLPQTQIQAVTPPASSKQKLRAIEDLFGFEDEATLKVIFATLRYHCVESEDTRPFNVVINELWEQVLEHPIVWEGMSTPYGNSFEDNKALDVEEIIPCMVGRVSTACHGGFKICCELNFDIPDEYRNGSGWYEEDVKWCIPFHFLRDQIMEQFRLAGVESPFDNKFWEVVDEMFSIMTLEHKPEESKMVN